jgi:hypothetical protein
MTDRMKEPGDGLGRQAEHPKEEARAATKEHVGRSSGDEQWSAKGPKKARAAVPAALTHAIAAFSPVAQIARKQAQARTT